ncbi:MAG: DUF4304 domain-containing protein [Flavobacteriaceae bacterium]|jgi:hypothetical protein|nr:DUF4304 domain-containing protein [Flavobacteriaceae bacterium]
MEKTKTEKYFDDLVSHIFTFFKPLGYKKKGNNFRYYNEEGKWGEIINFQKNRWNTKLHIKFTVNIGLYMENHKNDYNKHFLNDTKSVLDSFTIHLCYTQRRIGFITNYKEDKWFEVYDLVDYEKLKATLERDFVEFVIPFLDRIKTKEDILSLPPTAPFS